MAANHNNNSKLFAAKKIPGQQRHINQHEFEEEGYYPERQVDGEDFYSNVIEENHFGSLTINKAHQKPGRDTPGTRLIRKVWQSLSKEDQMTWERISDQGKNAIIYKWRDHC